MRVKPGADLRSVMVTIMVWSKTKDLQASTSTNINNQTFRNKAEDSWNSFISFIFSLLGLFLLLNSLNSWTEQGQCL